MELKNPMLSSNTGEEDGSQSYIYKKRCGTSGVTGQLYETKLLSLILFRALQDEEIDEFYIGNNLDDIGAFDDICFKFKLNNEWVAAFIQVKHRDDPVKGSITDSDIRHKKSDFNLQTYFESYLKIKQKFYDEKTKPNEQMRDKLFTEQFNNIQCYFIIYTSAISKVSKKKYNVQFNEKYMKIEDLISTSIDSDIFQIKYNESDINTIAQCLITKKLRFISKTLLIDIDNNERYSMQLNKIIQQYQNFLIPNVIEICETKAGQILEGKINPKLFFSNDILYIKLREILLDEVILKSECFDEKISENYLISLIYSKTITMDTLSKVIGNVVIFNKQTRVLDLAKTVPNSFLKFRNDLKNVPISETKVSEAYHLAGKEKLLNIKLLLPQLQGNVTPNKLTMKIELDSYCKDLSLNHTGIDFFENEKNIARDFLNNLYFCTKEAKQNQVENILKKEINGYNYNNTNKIFKAHTDGIFLNLHDKVQKWSMLRENATYLTNSCDFLTKSISNITDSPFLSVSNFNFVKKLQNYSIKFKDEIVTKLKSVFVHFGVTVIVSNTVMLTCIKLVEYLKCDKYSFLDYSYVSKLTFKEFRWLQKEILSSNLDILLIVHETSNYDFLCETIRNFAEKFPKKVIILTNRNISKESQSSFELNIYIDNNNNLVDLEEQSQKQILSTCTITVQGEKVVLSKIIDDKCKYLITGEVLLKLINNEIITIGQQLIDKKYEEINNIYVPRCLQNMESLKFTTNSVTDLTDKIVVITAEPGMGKSTLITHLALEMKTRNPNYWIVRTNLLEYSSHFLKWQNDKKEIDLKDSMTLICEAALNNVKGSFDMQVVDGALTLSHTDITGIPLLYLEFIIHCYNKDAIIFLFDGFDEVCPHYEKEVIQFIKNVIPSFKENENFRMKYNIFGYLESVFKNEYFEEFFQKRIWITSRSYNTVQMVLQDKFAVPYRLVPLSSSEQEVFYHRYFEINLKLDELSTEQFKNIEMFFKFMAQFRRDKEGYKVLHITAVPLHKLYVIAVDYFRNAILLVPLDHDIENLRNKWFPSYELLTTLERCIGNWHKLNNAMELISIPLHMYIAATYMVNQIKNTSQEDALVKWDLNINTFEFYESFLKTKFKTIRMEEKNCRYTSYPDERIAYEKEKKEFTESHKKLAFFSLFHTEKKYLRHIMRKKEQNAVKEIMKEIEDGKEKTGLIHHIYNKIPKFIHLVFAEYFACEYITDTIKSNVKIVKRKGIDFTMNCLLLRGSVGVMTILDQKLEQDDQLKNALTDTQTKLLIFKYLMKQNEMTELGVDLDGDYPYYKKKITTSLIKSMTNGLLNITKLLISSIENNLNESNINAFIEVLSQGFFIMAPLLSIDEVIVFVVDQIRTIDQVIARRAFSGNDSYYSFWTKTCVMRSNEDILASLYLNAKSLTTPTYYFDEYDNLYYTT